MLRTLLIVTVLSLSFTFQTNTAEEGFVQKVVASVGPTLYSEPRVDDPTFDILSKKEISSFVAADDPLSQTQLPDRKFRIKKFFHDLYSIEFFKQKAQKDPDLSDAQRNEFNSFKYQAVGHEMIGWPQYAAVKLTFIYPSFSGNVYFRNEKSISWWILLKNTNNNFQIIDVNPLPPQGDFFYQN